ncbi:MAG: hypothetical protein H7Y11_03080, partial [Armatimonadetes bacterium]|nr:hypothetical protein [Anaerolineae bacterium]
ALDRRYAGAYGAWKTLSRQDAGFAALNAQFEAWLQYRLWQLLALLSQLPQVRPVLDLDSIAWVLTLLLLALIERLTDDTLESAIHAMTHLIYHALFQDV